MRTASLSRRDRCAAGEFQRPSALLKAVVLQTCLDD